MTPHEVHKRDAAKIVDSIIRPMLDADGGMTDILVLLESVITGVILFVAKDGGDKIVLATLLETVGERLAEIRARRKAKIN